MGGVEPHKGLHHAHTCWSCTRTFSTSLVHSPGKLTNAQACGGRTINPPPTHHSPDATHPRRAYTKLSAAAGGGGAPAASAATGDASLAGEALSAVASGRDVSALKVGLRGVLSSYDTSVIGAPLARLSSNTRT